MEVLPDADPAHRIAARHVCALAADGRAGPAGRRSEPIYLRRPDAEVWREQRDRDTRARLSAAGAGCAVRRLVYGDLPAVLAIERRSFQTPWSLAMFVLELSKPSGICLAIADERGGLVGYLVCSRYADVWHLMNIAVAPERRRARDRDAS